MRKNAVQYRINGGDENENGPNPLQVKEIGASRDQSGVIEKAPRVGLEPTTNRLTAGCSTIELSGIIDSNII